MDYIDRAILDDSTPIAQAVAQDIRNPQRHAHVVPSGVRTFFPAVSLP